MDFPDFERHAREVFEQIPDVYREGIDGLTVRRSAPEHPDHPGVYTLGECLTEEHVSDFGSADTTRSIIALYWGAFHALSLENPDFDWEEEIWETLTHELRHHLESLAGDDALEDVDHASEETFKRFGGEDFDPWYYQYGDEVEPGLFRVEKAWYLEQAWREAAFADAGTVPFDWAGRSYRVPRPDDLGDVHFVLVRGLDLEDETLELVLVRKRSWWGAARRIFGAPGSVVYESEAEAEPVPRVG
jgi:hypothetical protein